MRDAIRRAQAWLEATKSKHSHRLLERQVARNNLAALGPASVGLAEKAQRLLDAMKAESDAEWDGPDLRLPKLRIQAWHELRQALTEWSEAAGGGAEPHA